MGIAASPEQALAFYSEEVSCPGCPCYLNRYTPVLKSTAANLRGVSAVFPLQVQGEQVEHGLLPTPGQAVPLYLRIHMEDHRGLEKLVGAEGKKTYIWSLYHPPHQWPWGGTSPHLFSVRTSR